MDAGEEVDTFMVTGRALFLRLSSAERADVHGTSTLCIDGGEGECLGGRREREREREREKEEEGEEKKG